MNALKHTLFAGLTTMVLLLSSCSLNFLQANLIDSGASNHTGKNLYISNNYTALTSDTGVIEVKSDTGFTDVSAISFVLKYNKSQLKFTDNFQFGSFKDGSGATIQPEVTMATPNNETGEVSVDIASSSAFSLPAGSTLISFTVNTTSAVQDGDQVEVSFSDSQVIDSLYNFQSVSTAKGVITIQATATETLKVLSATATSTTQIEVLFNDYLTDVSTVTAKVTSDIDSTASFSSVTSATTFSGIQISPTDGQKIILTTATPLAEGDTFKLLFGNGPTGNTKQTLDTNHTITYFVTPGTTLGTGSLSNIAVKTKNTISFSGSSETNPTKYRLFNSQGIAQVISSVSSGVLTTQSALIQGEKYYFIAENVSGMSKNKVAYFFVNLQGAASILSITPESVTATEGGSVTVTGTNLSQIQSVTINGIGCIITSKTDDSLKITVPANMTAGLTDIIFTTTTGTVITKEDFITLSDKALVLTVNSGESYASPFRVPNDAKTVTTLWVQVQDPRGLGDINKVTLDLRSIGGAAVTKMLGLDESGQMIVVDNKRWFYLKTVIPTTVKTSETARVIKVTAEDSAGNKAYGEISLMVTNDVKSSEVPEILESYATPTKILPGKSAGFYAYVKDLDGISDIDQVVVDLGPLGLGPKILKAASEITPASTATSTATNTTVTGTTTTRTTTGATTPTTTPTTTNTTATTDVVPTERVSMWYGIESLTIPENTAVGSYSIKVKATDKSGEIGTSTITITVGGGNAPYIDIDKLVITPRTSIPHDGKTTFTVQAYIKDSDGVNDITAVFADISEVGGTQVDMDLQGTGKDGQLGGFFLAKDLTVSKETLKGYKVITVYAYDKQGNEAKAEVDLQVTDDDEVGSAPMINSTRSYTSPAAVEPDATTKVTLNAFITENNFTISQVYVDLTNIAKYTGTQTASTADSANSCLGSTERMVCMTPGLKEGSLGQWYTLKDVVVLKTTPASMEPYQIPVTAIDVNGKTGYGYIYLNVGDGTLPTEQIGFPKVQMAISTSPETIEVVFSNPINPSGVTLNAFKITSTTDTKEVLPITETTINADATVVTITTNEQMADKGYTLFADAKKLGLKESQYTDNHADFIGFNKSDIPPQLVKITAKSSTMLELIFSEGLRPSSVEQNASDFQIFTHDAKPVRLAVKHVEFAEDNLTLRVSTDKQISDQTYTLRVNNIYSAAGVRVGGNEKPTQTASTEYFGIHKTFKGFKGTSKDTKTVIESVDFDGNGKVDFTDFTIFSSVYGQSLENSTVQVTLPTAPTPVPTTPATQQPASEARAAEVNQIPATSSVTAPADKSSAFGIQTNMINNTSK